MKMKTQTSVTLRGDKKRAKLRILGLDIIRSLAILFVIAGHFFVLHTPFRSTNFEGLSLFLQAGIIPLFQTGVPLFIMLTGYLNTNKVSEKKYYRGIWKVLIAYVFFSILTLFLENIICMRIFHYSNQDSRFLISRQSLMRGILRCGLVYFFSLHF